MPVLTRAANQYYTNAQLTSKLTESSSNLKAIMADIRKES